MKIILIQNDLPPDHFGGSEVLTLGLAQKFSNRGAHVTILTRKLPFHKGKDEIEGIPIRRIGIPYKRDKRSLIHRVVWFLSFLFFGCIVCIKLKPDIIHSHTRIPGGVISGITSCVTHASSFITIHSDLEALSSFEKVITSFIIKINQNIVVQTKLTQKQVLKLCSSRIHIIPNGINFNDRHIKQNEFSNEILFIGRLHPIKGLKFAIKACKILKDREIPFRFNIIGNGFEKCQLKKLVQDLCLEDKVFFLGSILRDKKKAVFQGASYFLLPSVSECFPISILEAMKAGLYIIAAKVGGIPEMLVYGKYGRLVPPKDELALANTLEIAFNEEELAKIKKINSAYKYARKRFNLNAVARKHLKKYYLAK